MRTKVQTFTIFQKFFKQANWQLGNKLKHLHFNFREKFAYQALKNYITKEDIKWEPNVPYILKQNGKIEWLNYILISLV